MIQIVTKTTIKSIGNIDVPSGAIFQFKISGVAHNPKPIVGVIGNCFANEEAISMNEPVIVKKLQVVNREQRNLTPQVSFGFTKEQLELQYNSNGTISNESDLKSKIIESLAEKLELTINDFE